VSDSSPTSMQGHDDNRSIVTGYMCLTDFECELGAAMGGNRVFPSIEDAKLHKPCWPHCGLVEVEVRAVRIVVTGDGQ
jgi:hypothetical protein